jgi:transposase-like protein
MEQQDGQQPKKRARKTIALETKIKMIGEVEAGLMTMTDIAKKYDINKQTLSNIVSCKDKNHDQCQHKITKITIHFQVSVC